MSKKDTEIYTVEGCARPYKSKGWCGMHYKRAYTHGDPAIALPQGRQVGKRKTINCVVGGCSRPPTTESGKYCPIHHKEFLETGKQPRAVWKLSDEERFWAKVMKLGSESEDNCWIWYGGLVKKKGSTKRYGNFGFEGRSMLAHRYSYQLATGEKLESHTPIHHKCAEPLCVFPKHLQATTPEENTAEMLARHYYIKRIAELEAQLAECACGVNT